MIKKVLGSLFFAGAMLVAGNSFAQDQAQKDEQILKEYFAKNGIKATRTPSGLYYTIKKKGSGDNAKVGQTVTMNYYGKLLDGKRFDSNGIDDNFNPVPMSPGRTAFSFPLGAHRVIAGWDEAVQLLNKGEQAVIYLPSGIAYGPNGAGGAIPPNAVLVFDVEVVAIQ